MSFNIIYAGMVESTNMSMTEKLVTIIRAFSYEMSAVAKSYNGYVLKYVGDAIILFFPSSFNKYRCASSMINVVKNGINPVLNNDFSQENVVVQYGYEKRSPIDLLVCCT